MQLDDTGQPVYGPRDDVNAEALKKLGVPFWLAGGEAEAGSVERAIGRGAQGVQIGTAFAYCDESGLAPSLKQAAITRALGGTVKVFTDPSASPSGYPFKVVELGGTLSEEQLYQSRERVCDVGMLRTVTRRPDGVLAYRCPSEPVDDYVRKGGDIADTVGRKCLCNALLADVELGQLRGDAVELPLVTAGDDIRNLTRYVDQEHPSYSAADVIDHVLAPA
jgi:NAD(P)H-dependent flavin oxidoreductase YrpB (nitropropane dioxygenase family)